MARKKPGKAKRERLRRHHNPAPAEAAARMRSALAASTAALASLPPIPPLLGSVLGVIGRLAQAATARPSAEDRVRAALERIAALAHGEEPNRLVKIGNLAAEAIKALGEPKPGMGDYLPVPDDRLPYPTVGNF